MTVFSALPGDHAKPPRGASRMDLGLRMPLFPMPLVPKAATPSRGLPEPGTMVYFRMLVRPAGRGLFGFAGSSTYRRTAWLAVHKLGTKVASLVLEGSISYCDGIW